MEENILPYSVGPLLYCPAVNKKLASNICRGDWGEGFSVSLCLEDAVADSAVLEAEKQAAATLWEIYEKAGERAFYLPRIFIRVRSAAQILRVAAAAGAAGEMITGFIFPKFMPENADEYFEAVLSAEGGRRLYMMPIIESEAVLNPAQRAQILLKIREKTDAVADRILNIRVGGNDLCNGLGLRRHRDETIYDLLPVAQVLGDILCVFGKDYVVSGAVWEYFDGQDGEWKKGLERELRMDRANGFVGKTVIHPNQIEVVRKGMMVDAVDYADARNILAWKDEGGLMVAKNASAERMNEKKTHERWAKKTAALAEIYGVKD